MFIYIYITMKCKTDKLTILNNRINKYRQYIQLLNGKEVLDKIDMQIAIDETNRALAIKDPKKFQDYTELFTDI